MVPVPRDLHQVTRRDLPALRWAFAPFEANLTVVSECAPVLDLFEGRCQLFAQTDNLGASDRKLVGEAIDVS
jgi:hypothetical protein